MTSVDRRELAERVELVAIEMGYGHLRPAHSLAELIPGAEVLHADRPPLSNEEEQKKWQQARASYEMLSRASRLPVLGGVLGDLLEGITAIPSMYPRRDLSGPTMAVRLLQRMANRGLGAGLAARLQRSNKALLTTFFGPAVLSDYHGCEHLYCVVTDSDVNRVWAQATPRHTNITYCAPSPRVRRRLKAYGVPSERIVMTGYPLPHGLLGGPEVPILRRNVRRRLAALDPRRRFLKEGRAEVGYFLGEVDESDQAAPHLVFAVGGAGAQAEMAYEFLPSLARLVRQRRVKLTLVAGIRSEVAAIFRQAIERSGLQQELDEGQIQVLLADTHDEYFERFNRLLHETDILWTKPSELSFFGALGLPLLFSSPMGAHERYNRRWAVENGSGVRQYDPRHAGEWLWEMIEDGTLAGAAWNGYMRMPKFGLYRIVEEVLGPEGLERCLQGHELQVHEMPSEGETAAYPRH